MKEYDLPCAGCDERRTGTYFITQATYCMSCAAERRHAAARLVRLRPHLERVIAIVEAMRRVATVGTRDDGWKSTSFGPDIASVLTLLGQVEADIEHEVDEWSLLVLRLNAEGESTIQKTQKRKP